MSSQLLPYVWWNQSFLWFIRTNDFSNSKLVQTRDIFGDGTAPKSVNWKLKEQTYIVFQKVSILGSAQNSQHDPAELSISGSLLPIVCKDNQILATVVTSA